MPDTPLHRLQTAYLETLSQQYLHEWELENPLLDSVDRIAPRASYAILCPQRTGSHLLCRYLLRLGLGIPAEYMNPLFMDGFSRRWGGRVHTASYKEMLRRCRSPGTHPTREERQMRQDLEDDYYRRLLDRRSHRGGWFAAKVQPPHQEMFEESLSRLFERLRFRFLVLRRRDLLGAAASLHFSRCTGMWDTGQRTTIQVQPVAAMFDPDVILESFHRIGEQDRACIEFMSQNPRIALPLVMEDLVAETSATLARIQEFLGVEPKSVPAIPAPDDAYHKVRRSCQSSIRQILVKQLQDRGDLPVST